MSLPVSADDWRETECWWDAFTGDRQVILASEWMRRVDGTWKRGQWDSVDQFWEGFKADHDSLVADRFTQQLDRSAKEPAWEEIDQFWGSYAGEHRSEIAELRRLLRAVRDVWADGASSFDDDPLAADWRSQSSSEGPLRRGVHEEDWSHWLAHLLRQSTGAFPAALLGTPEREPARVRREVVFYGDRSDRRVDILVEYTETAVSIEVKAGDEQYGKTPHTAELIERHDDREWAHVLLLQRSKRSQLRYTFGEALKQPVDERPVIQASGSPEVAVLFWQDVSRVLRLLLIERREPDSHWQASAYLFVTLIEQRLLEFHSISELRPSAGTAGEPVARTDVHWLAAVDPTAQIEYLRAVLTERNTYE